MSVHDLVAQFEQCTLPKSAWSHAAHLTVGACYVRALGADRAMTTLRDRIRAYNASVGGVNSDTEGYHETITQAYVTLLHDYLRGCDATAPIDTLIPGVLLTLGAPDLLLRYYERSTLYSVAARSGWIPPDRAPLQL